MFDGTIVGLVLAGVYTLGTLTLSWLAWLTLGITIAHTIEEALGLIWEELNIPLVAYLAFQVFVLALGIAIDSHPEWVWLFVGIRLVDFFWTHRIKGASGQLTSWLLPIDALLWIFR